jgi:hypothetical protein
MVRYNVMGTERFPYASTNERLDVRATSRSSLLLREQIDVEIKLAAINRNHWSTVSGILGHPRSVQRKGAPNVAQDEMELNARESDWLSFRPRSIPPPDVDAHQSGGRLSRRPNHCSNAAKE